MSLLTFIVVLIVVSLDLLVPSTFFTYPRFSIYIFSVKLECPSEDLLSSCSCCFSRFAGALPNFGFPQVPNLYFMFRYVLLEAYLLSTDCFFRFAGILPNFASSKILNLHFPFKISMSFLI